METEELQERRLEHPEEAEKFCRDLTAQGKKVRVGMEAPGPGRLRYLLVMTANTFRLIQEIHATVDRTPAALRALFRKYNSELL
jgi:hypothetical protein